MKSRARVYRLELLVNDVERVCSRCGKTKEQWSITVVLHADRQYSAEQVGCDACRSYCKVFIFDDEMYQEERAKPPVAGTRVILL